jgi:drug/metabolite transporter (DMT)-like permease
MLFSLMAVACFSVSAVTARALGGTEANFWRLCVATLLLALYAHRYGSGLHGPSFPIFFLSGVLGFGLGDMALFQALPRLGSRLSIMLVHCVASPFAGIVEWIWLNTKVDLDEILSALIILSGVVIALGDKRPTTATTKPGFKLGVAFGILAAIGQALGAILSRHAFQTAAHAGLPLDGISAAYQRIIGGVILSGICLLIAKLNQRQPVLNPPSISQSQPSQKWRTQGPWILINGLAGPALGVSCYQWALKTTPTAIVLPIIAITPLAIIPIAHWMGEESVTKRSLIGGFVAVAGVAILGVLRH